MTNDCKTCPVSTGTHKPAEALHQQIDEPQSEALRLAAWLLHRGMSGIKQNDIEASNQLRWLHAESLQHKQELAAYRFTVANREARIAELESQLEAIGAGGVEPLRKQAAQAVHQIAEPAAPAGKPIKDAIDALVMAAFTEGGCSEHRMSEARIQTELRKKELCTLLSTPQACCRSHPHEEMTPMCELRTEIARLTNALARAEAAAPQAVQAAVPLFWVRLLRDGLYEGPVHNNSVGGKMLRDEKPGEWHPLYLHTAPAHPAEGVPAQPLQMFESPRAKILMQAWQEGFAACRDAEYVGEEAENDAFNQSMTLNHCIAEDELHATHPTQQGLDAQALKQSFREYLSVSEHIDAGGHAMDSIATDLTRIVLAEEEVSAVIARRVHCNTSGQSGEDAENIRAAAQAKQGGV